MKEYKNELSKLIERKLGKKIDFQKDVSLVMDNADGPRIAEWNLPEKQPTEKELETLWATEKNNIRREQAIKQLDGKHYEIFLNKLFDDYKSSDSTYKAELKAINDKTSWE